ncbi:hypothetical protein ACIF6L_19880 [Kitasatospora sp. NPDC086009]|uniref:hypothetical protein n=1 Tax=unclassified Kitasatospora TaxID=2633591 RepID=UPI0037C530C2
MPDVNELVSAVFRGCPPSSLRVRRTLGRARNTYRYYDVLGEVGGPLWTPERDILQRVRCCLRAHHQQ